MLTLGRLKVFKETLAALLFDASGLIAGSLAVAFSSLILLTPWSLMLYPMSLSVRGAVNGVFASRLGTNLHLGLIKPQLRRNTIHYHALTCSSFTLSLILSLIIGLIVFTISKAFYNIKFNELLFILSICIATQGLVTIVIEPITSFLGFFSFKKGADPDVIVYPVSSTIADILVTIFYIFMLTLGFKLGLFGKIILNFIALSYIFLTLLNSLKFRKEKSYLKVVKEAFFGVLIAAVISAISGFSLSKVKNKIEMHKSFIRVYPALIDTIGDSGAVFGSLLTTKFALGLIKPKLTAIKNNLNELKQIASATLIMYIFYGVLASLNSSFINFLIIVLTFLIVFPLVAILSFFTAVATCYKGLDPDNFTVPIEMASSDGLITLVLALLIALIII
ncbi:MAG: magnesium transporter [Candidatus Bathyarchaeia archaeon]|nr:magnesium transporter [Candidatus Bathyarchaeota archaeon]